MRNRLFTLAAALALAAKPFMIGSIATAANMTDSGGFASAFLRYLVAPQSVSAICLFFLFYEPGRYAPFRPLVIVLQALSLSTGLVAAYRALGAADFAYLAAGDLTRAVALGFLILLVDLFGLIAAITAPTAIIPPTAPTAIIPPTAPTTKTSSAATDSKES